MPWKWLGLLKQLKLGRDVLTKLMAPKARYAADVSCWIPVQPFEATNATAMVAKQGAELRAADERIQDLEQKERADKKDCTGQEAVVLEPHGRNYDHEIKRRISLYSGTTLLL